MRVLVPGSELVPISPVGPEAMIGPKSHTPLGCGTMGLIAPSLVNGQKYDAERRGGGTCR